MCSEIWENALLAHACTYFHPYISSLCATCSKIALQHFQETTHTVLWQWNLKQGTRTVGCQENSFWQFNTHSFHSLSWDVSWMCNIYLIYDNSFLEVGFFFSSSLPYLIYCHCFISGTFLAARKLLRCRPYSLVWVCVSGILLSGLSFYLLWEHVVVHTHISSGFPWENLDYKVFNCLQWNLWLSLY